MRVAVVGAGFTGLAAGIQLVDKGITVEIFEKEKQVGGLAGSIQRPSWKWNLEIFYHHIFTNDKDIIELAKKVDCPPVFKQPKTSSFIEGNIWQLDSPVSVLKFSGISFFSRIRMGLGLGLLKVIPYGLFLEKYKVVDLLPVLIGKEAYEKIWERLLSAKFGGKSKMVNMAWFWSRVAKRTAKLGYFEGGFWNLAQKMRDYIEKKGGKIILETNFDFSKKNRDKYDKIIITVPGAMVEKLTGESSLPKIDYLWAQTLILELKRSLMTDYWLNILEKDWPFLVVVEHTNFADKKNYGGKTIVYLGNYLEDENKQLKLNKEEILELYISFLKKINPQFEKGWVEESYLFRSPFAQPVFPVNYSKQLEKIKIKNKKFVFANMSLVYPFDRGTNYAIKTGVEAAKKCLS